MNDVDKLLEQLKDLSSPKGMEERILFAVRREARKQQVVISLLYLALLPAVLLLFWSARLFATDLEASFFIPSLKLVISDFSRVLAIFGDWGLALVETFPVSSLALTLTSLFIVVILVVLLLRLSGLGVKRMTKVLY